MPEDVDIAEAEQKQATELAAEEAKSFKELGLSEGLVNTLDELGYSEPTPIQARAIPELIGGNDVIGQAQTGSGKTAAFGLPMLDYIDPENEETQAFVLTPTRELCIQVTQAMRAYAEHLDGVEIVAVFGGAPIREQQARLRHGAQVVVATVGRMMDLINRQSLVLTAARYVVLDEADEMLDLGFIEDVEKILRMCPSGRQTALFSATMPAPVARLAETYMYDPVTIRVTPKKLTVDSVEQAYVMVEPRDKLARVVEVLKTEEPEQAIIFCRTKIGASRLERDLSNKGLRVKALHGDLSQGQRDGVMISFKEHKVPLLVATDIAARGLDIEHVTHVINYDLPNNPEIYVHRIGRTGRVGRTGRAITFVTDKQVGDLKEIERTTKSPIGEWERPEDRLEHAPRPRRRERGRDLDAPEPEPEPEDAPEEELEVEDQVEAGESDDVEDDHVEEEVEVHLELDADRGPDDDDEYEFEPESKSESQPERKRERGRERRPRRERKPRERKPEPERAPLAEGDVKLFVNRGTRGGVEEDDLRWALTEGAVIPEDAISSIRVLERFSFVELGEEHADKAVEMLDGTKLKGKQIRMEVARS